VSECRFVERNTVNTSHALSQCPVNTDVFKSFLKCSESTAAGSYKSSGSEFQTVGSSTEEVRRRLSTLLRWIRGSESDSVDGAWHFDRELQTLNRMLLIAHAPLSRLKTVRVVTCTTRI